MIELLKVDQYKTCPKCGEDKFSSDYHKRAIGVDLQCVPGKFRHVEHVHRKCLNCGFEWLAKPLDA